MVTFSCQQVQEITAQEAELKQIIDDPRVKLDYIEKPQESIVSPFDTELFRVIESELPRLFPGSLVLPHLIIYGTDSRLFRPKGAICYGFFPGPVTMAEYRSIHGNDERVRESSLRQAVQAYFTVVSKFCSR